MGGTAMRPLRGFVTAVLPLSLLWTAGCVARPSPVQVATVPSPEATPLPNGGVSATPSFPPLGKTCPLKSKMYALDLANGKFKMATFKSFDLPSGSIRLDVGPGDASCVHKAVVPYPDGFGLKAFCIPALNFTMVIKQTGCGIGRIDSNGGSDFTVRELCDTSSPSVCKAAQPAGCSSSGSDNAGQVDITVGNGSADVCAAPKGANMVVEIPVRTTLWLDASNACPDPEFERGIDTLVLSFEQVLDLTTDTATADFVDLDKDKCCIAGIGTASNTSPCSPGGAGPYAATGSCLDLAGLDAPGTDVTLVAAGGVPSGSTPIGDFSYSVTLPAELKTSGAYAGAKCERAPRIDFTGSQTRCLH
jgi:hypothetical protein